MQAAIKHIHQLIQQANTEAALHQLIQLFQKKNAFREHHRLATLLHAEYQKLQQQELGGLLTTNELQVAENRLHDRILKLLAAIQQPELIKDLRVHYPPPKPRIIRWFLPIAALLLASLLYFSGFFQNKQPETFDLSVYFYGNTEEPQLLTEGSVQFTYDGKPETKSPDQEGRIVLSDLRQSLRSDTLYIHPDIPDFSKRKIALAIPEDRDHMEIILPFMSKTLTAYGSLIDQDAQPVIQAQIQIDGEKTLTDSLGDFSLEMPFDPNRIKLLRAIKDGSIIYEGNVTVGELPIRIKTTATDEN